MSDERWERLKSIFHAALAQPPEQRRAWLAHACGGDVALLQEAETLLQSLDSAGDFLERPAQIDADAADVLAPGTVIGPYRITRDIGRGGMGIVYLAEDMRLGRRVALKALPPDMAANPELKQRLRREARAAATIAHPTIATVYALEEIDEHLFIASEYVEGETLRAALTRGPLPAARVHAVAVQIARALCAAHDAGVVHRDLKPENILLTPAGDVKVVDFGIAHVEGPEATRLTRAGAVLGTPAYMAPEQLLGSEVDARADLYAFGVLLTEMVTGRHPLTGEAATPPPPFATIVARCLQAEPSARYASARALLSAVESLPADPSGATEQPGADPATATRTNRAAAGSARWWWEFHQAATAAAYWLTMVPAWRARDELGAPWGRTFFIALLVSVVVAANLRLNLWFTSRFYPAELRWTRRRVGRWIRGADWTFASTLAAGGLAIGEDRSPVAALLVAIAIGAVVAFLVIERVTTRAAFRGTPTAR
jgi:tRNA A-37 threonylcarbamoyl transferase component Bud32